MISGYLFNQDSDGNAERLGGIIVAISKCLRNRAGGKLNALVSRYCQEICLGPDAPTMQKIGLVLGKRGDELSSRFDN